MSIDRHFSITQFTWLMGTFLGLIVAVFLGSAVGSQDFRIVAVVLGAGIGISTFLILGKNYWMLIPFSLGASFPAVPLGGRSLEFPELAIAGCFAFFLLRIATRKEQLHVFRSVNVPFLLFMAWVGMVFVLNPIGLAMLGSQTGGARFYLKIALAFTAFIVLSNRSYSEKDIKVVFGLMVFGAFFSMVYSIAEYAFLGPSLDPSTGMVREEFYSWHQALSLPAITIAFIIFARWSPASIFSISHLPLVILYILCLGLVLLSGKRMALAAVLLAPVVSAILHRQFRYFPIAVAGLLCLASVVLLGQGQFFSLPLVAQRTLSWLPGEWDPELDSIKGGSDEWRAGLRRFAIENIKRDPWIGRGFAVDLSETISAVGMQRYDGSIEGQTASYALGRAWHNTWLGYAADFGIPFPVFQAIIYGSILYLSSLTFQRSPARSWYSAFAMFVFIFTCRDLMASWTSGHSALDAFNRWWMYGIVVAIYLQTRVSQDHTARAEPSRPVADKFHAARPVSSLH
jgi:hypothetical protein